MTSPSRRSLVSIWVLLAVTLGGLLAIAQAAEGPLDDPDPAYQRPGILDLGALPVRAPRVTAEVPAPGRAAVVFFVRPAQLAALCRALDRAPLHGDPGLVVVVAGPTAPCPSVGEVVADAGYRLASGYGMRQPRGGGPPVGYAVVDDAGQIRYLTLDPGVDDMLDEVDTILSAL
ncbi:MAG: hypothetical protein ACR2G7_07780 [Acidimicrobiales bacterium]